MKILAISPHPDDETLGCGGTLLRHQSEGDELYWTIVTQAHTPQWSEDLIAKKALEVDAVAAAYGMQQVTKLGLPTTKLDEIPLSVMIDKLREVIETVRPEVVYLIDRHDVNTEHQLVFSAALVVMKTFYMRRFGVRQVLSWESLSSTEAAPQHGTCAFVPNVYRDITSYLERKLQIMALYQSEVQPEPMPRSPSALRALARYRGASIGVEYAEAFVLVRDVN